MDALSQNACCFLDSYTDPFPFNAMISPIMCETSVLKENDLL